MTTDITFDPSPLRELIAELGEENTLNILRAFLADTAEKLERIRAGEQGRVTIEREAHSIKSSAATFGFDGLSRAARKLESLASELPKSELDEMCSRLRAVFEATQRFAHAVLLKDKVAA